MKLRKLTLILTVLLTLLITATGCKTTTSESYRVIPSISSIKPERPTLEGTYEEMLRTLLLYTFQLEVFVEVQETYMENVNAVLISE